MLVRAVVVLGGRPVRGLLPRAVYGWSRVTRLSTSSVMSSVPDVLYRAVPLGQRVGDWLCRLHDNDITFVGSWDECSVVPGSGGLSLLELPGPLAPGVLAGTNMILIPRHADIAACSTAHPTLPGVRVKLYELYSCQPTHLTSSTEWVLNRRQLLEAEEVDNVAFFPLPCWVLSPPAPTAVASDSLDETTPHVTTLRCSDVDVTEGCIVRSAMPAALCAAAVDGVWHASKYFIGVPDTTAV